MKPQWNNLSEQLADFTNMLDEYLEKAEAGNMAKAANIVRKTWNKIIHAHNEFDKLVESVGPIPIDSPFKSEEFAEQWQIYKDYLQEEFGAYIKSRRELMMIRRLRRFSGNDEQLAIEILEYYMSCGHRPIYPPTEKQLKGEEPPSTIYETATTLMDKNIDPSIKI